MHEMSLMKNVVDIVLRECEDKDVRSVRNIYLTIGEQRDVIDEYAQSLFTYLAEGTVAEDATLVFKKIPFMVRCTECGDIFKLNVHDPKTWECPRCHARQKYRIFCGHQLTIDKIEFEIGGEADCCADPADQAPEKVAV